MLCCKCPSVSVVCSVHLFQMRYLAILDTNIVYRFVFICRRHCYGDSAIFICRTGRQKVFAIRFNGNIEQACNICFAGRNFLRLCGNCNFNRCTCGNLVHSCCIQFYRSYVRFNGNILFLARKRLCRFSSQSYVGSFYSFVNSSVLATNQIKNDFIALRRNFIICIFRR